MSTPGLQLYRHSAMIRAIYYAVAYTATHSGFRAVWDKFLGMLSLWWSSRNSKLSQRVVDARLEACEMCPLYCWELKTCGDARHPQLWHDQTTQSTQPMGCFCWLPAKAKLSEATCWLDDQSVEPMRWPE